jgi:hypothetical protein
MEPLGLQLDFYSLRIATHGVGFERLPECTPASPMRQNEVASAHSPSRAAP